MTLRALERVPAFFLLFTFLLPLFEPWLLLPTLIIVIPFLPRLRGRTLILMASAFLGWSSGNSISQTHDFWSDLASGIGYVDVEGTWLRDVYTIGEPPYAGWARITPTKDGISDSRLSKKARVTLKTSQDFEDSTELMVGSSWNGRVLFRNRDDSSFLDVSYKEQLSPSIWASLRSTIILRLEKHWRSLQDHRSLPLLRALITGDRYGLEKEQKLPFTRLGLLALLAISGLHLGLIFLCVRALLGRWLPESSHWIALFISLVYALLGGWSVALMRSFGMCALAVLARNISRKYIGWNALFFMAWLELVLHPSNIRDPSFLLTYGGVLGILWSSEVSRVFHQTEIPNPKSGILKKVVTAYIISWGAMLFTWPTTGIFFNSVPTLAWLFAPPFFLTFSIVMGWVFLCVLISLVCDLSPIFLAPLDIYLDILNYLSASGSWIAVSIPGNSLWLIPYFLGLFLILPSLFRSNECPEHLER